MVDLHTHALFGIDDGAETIENSLAILKRAEDAGVKKMALTPHFSIGDDLEGFLEKRNRHFEMLKAEAENTNIELCCGAEVYITDELYNERDLKKLVIGKSRVMLTEFKYHGIKREKLLGYIDEILSHDVEILLAHVERYSFVRNDMWLLEKLFDRGVMLQINAISLFEEGEEGEFARTVMKQGLVYAVGSDIHSLATKRLSAMEKLHESRKWEKFLCENPEKIFDAKG